MGDPDPIVYVIDDDASMREAIRSLLGSVGLQVKLFGSVHEFWGYERPDTACCLILDVRLPGTSGLDFQSRLADAGIPIPIIFITGHADVPMSVRAMKAGAVEFLTKPFRDQELLDAIHVSLALDAARRKSETAVRALRERYDHLTPRERDVLSGVVAGKLNKQIAADLGTSEITIKVHRASVMRKMQAATLADLVRMATYLNLNLAVVATKIKKSTES